LREEGGERAKEEMGMTVERRGNVGERKGRKRAEPIGRTLT
jgi:hypothetical protein